MITPLHPEHRDQSYSEGRIDIGLEETQNIDYKKLKFDVIKQLPFASTQINVDEKGKIIYHPTIVSKSIIGDYYLSRGISYQDVNALPAVNGISLVQRKNQLKSWLSSINGEDYNYVPFNAFYQLSKEITNSSGLLLSKGINITTDFLDSNGGTTTQYDTREEIGEFFNIYFRIFNNLGNSVYSSDDQFLINDRFSFQLSFNGKDITDAIDNVSFQEREGQQKKGYFTMKIKLSSLESSGKLTLNITYLYYGIVRSISCYVKISEYSLIFINNENNSILYTLNEPEIDEVNNIITFANNGNCDFHISQGDAVHYYLNFAILYKKQPLQIDTISPNITGSKIDNDSIEVGGYKINSRFWISNTLGQDSNNPLLPLNIELTCEEKKFNISLTNE